MIHQINMFPTINLTKLLYPELLTTKERLMDTRFTTRTQLISFLELWHDKFPQLRRIGDAGILHERAEDLADEMLSLSTHKSWEITKQYPLTRNL